MNELDDFLKADYLKYAVITKTAYEADEVARGITGSPAAVGDSHVILSIEPSRAADFAAYVEGLGFEFEFEFVADSKKVSLLSHEQAKDLMAKYAEVVE